ncbi:helix-turn-helix domain-containing protein [Galbibacter orientalis]|uniref:helix-turn-helix domain-containing protein n=1 Tax=Galbibacter orientalis TaxID=453852 RepID=UPI003001EE3C
MSSNIEIIRVCEFCKKEFKARTTVTRFCSHNCNRKAYKARVKSEKIQKSNIETTRKRTRSHQEKPQDIELIQTKEFLTVKDIALLMNCSRQTVYKIINSGKLKPADLNIKKFIIKRSSLDKLLSNE